MFIPAMNQFRTLTLCLILGMAASRATAANVTVFAAASLKDSLQALAATYEAQSGDKIVFNFAASGMLARQIEAGAPADLFFSADESRADALAQQGLLASGSRRDVLGNSLVIITTPEHAVMASAAALTNAEFPQVALGEVKTVPCGAYAKSYLQQQGVWAAIEPKVIPCDNVRAVLAAVETGNVEAGVVYRTDARLAHNVKVAYAVPVGAGPRIIYPLALLKDAPQPVAAQKFASFLESAAAAAVFKQYGFLIPAANPP